MGNRTAHGLASPTTRIRSRRLRAAEWVRHRAHRNLTLATPSAEAPGAVEADSSLPAQSLSPSLCSLHMRGGLGKSLLLAFLLLAIVPLSILAFITYHEVQRYVEEGVLASLQTIVSLQEAHLLDWVAANERELALVAAAIDRPGQETSWADKQPAAADLVQAELEAQLRALQPAYTALVLADVETGQILASADSQDRTWPAGLEGRIDPELLLEPGLMVKPLAIAKISSRRAPAGDELAVRYAWNGKLLLGLLSWGAVGQVIASPGLAVEGLRLHLVTADGSVFSAAGGQPALLSSNEVPMPPVVGRFGRPLNEADETALRVVKSRAGGYQDGKGAPVFGAYRWVPELGLGLLAEQPQEVVLSGGDAATALIVGATLAVALLTAAIAAFVTRQITRPIVQLTATASWMARGDLSRRVAITRRDEIGVLAGAFNRMAAELQILYAALEARVAERTAQLARANEQARQHARQLSISVEVARVASSIRDLPVLLTTVVELICRAFELDHVSIYLLCQKVLPPPVDEVPAGALAAVPSLALWQAFSDGRLALQGSVAACVPPLVAEALAARSGASGTMRASGGPPQWAPGTPTGEEVDVPASSPAGAQEIAVPMQVCGRTLGVLHVTGGSAASFADGAPLIYRSLADQIAIAIENASAYALEHETVRRLRELDRIQSRFLTNMSHALRTPLNTIIGFSRVMLKGLDGSLNDLQQVDLATIHEGGRQLLGLIDDLLELSQWDIAPFDPDQLPPAEEGREQAPAVSDGPALSESSVDLAEIIEGVMATACALARDKPIHLYHHVPGDLPSITTDGRLVRRLILALLADAVKFTHEGQIRLGVTASSHAVTISVSTSGSREPVFTQSSAQAALKAEYVLDIGAVGEQGHWSRSSQPWTRQGHAAVCQHIVERLGGELLPAGSCPERLDAQDRQEEDGIAFAFSLPITGKEATGSYDQPGGQS